MTHRTVSQVSDWRDVKAKQDQVQNGGISYTFISTKFT